MDKICGAYAEHWEELGKPKGWLGCSLPEGHSGDHGDHSSVCVPVEPSKVILTGDNSSILRTHNPGEPFTITAEDFERTSEPAQPELPRELPLWNMPKKQKECGRVMCIHQPDNKGCFECGQTYQNQADNPLYQQALTLVDGQQEIILDLYEELEQATKESDEARTERNKSHEIRMDEAFMFQKQIDELHAQLAELTEIPLKKIKELGELAIFVEKQVKLLLEETEQREKRIAELEAKLAKAVELTRDEIDNLITCFKNESMRRYGKVNQEAPILLKLKLIQGEDSE